MKTLTIYKREYKKVGQFVIYYGGVEFMRNFKEHVDVNDKNLKVKFNKMYESSSFVKFNLLLNDVFKKRTNEFYHNLYFSLKLFDKMRTFIENEPYKERNQSSDIIFDEFIPMQKAKIK